MLSIVSELIPCIYLKYIFRYFAASVNPSVVFSPYRIESLL
nr:MAG TPA: hypothetical protein [Caudoviricetes sp.]